MNTKPCFNETNDAPLMTRFAHYIGEKKTSGKYSINTEANTSLQLLSIQELLLEKVLRPFPQCSLV